jgi:hypothetical protein
MKASDQPNDFAGWEGGFTPAALALFSMVEVSNVFERSFGIIKIRPVVKS